MNPNLHAYDKQSKVARGAFESAWQAFSSPKPDAADSWIQEHSPIGAVFAQCAGYVPPGWHCLFERTLIKLLRLVDGSEERVKAIAGLSVCCSSVHMAFDTLPSKDSVVLGILRKSSMASRCTCHQCGRPARLREIGEEGRATLCVRCAAPVLLREDIWQLQQSLRFLRAVNVYVIESQVPQLLRRSFLEEAAKHPEDHSDTGKPRMSPTRFAAWAAGWEKVQEQLAATY